MCCRRNFADLEDSTTRYFPVEKIGNNWGSLVRRAQRLAFKRRCWAFLGCHLNLIKEREARGDPPMAAATQEELIQALEALRALQGQQQVELLRLAAESAELRDAALPSVQLGALRQELVNAVNTFATARVGLAAGDRRVKSLIGIMGLGKPMAFKNGEQRFIEWLRKTTSFASAAYGASFRTVLEWAEDQEQPITIEDLEVQFGAEGAEDYVDDIAGKGSQLHVAPQVLTEGESFDIVLGARLMASRRFGG